MKPALKLAKRFRVFVASVSFAALAILALAAREVFDYSAAPIRPKECDFSYPAPSPRFSRPATLTLSPATQPPFEQSGGYLNDASCLNRTPVLGMVAVRSEADVRTALAFARAAHVKVIAAGVRHSMGGQSLARNGIVLDMRGFNGMHLDREHSILNVQSGATWEEVQKYLDPRGFAVKAMQSINIFTVGGALSVNAHGIAHNPGQVAATVDSFRIMTADGIVRVASPSENPQLFRAALGGYGLVGVILDVNLQVVPNEMYIRRNQYMNYRDFPAFYRQRIENQDNVGLAYGRLSISPRSYLTEAAIHVYEKTPFAEPLSALQPPNQDALDRFVINFSKTGGFGRWLRWSLEKYAEPHLHICSRNNGLAWDEPCLVSRNQEMYDSMGYLRNRLRDTDILQEYFVAPKKMPEFVDGLRATVRKDRANLLNVTIRFVHRDDITALPYAREDMFAFVLYFSQKLNLEDSRRLQQTTVDLIDLAEKLQGTFYLPYQLYYSKEQLLKAYPGANQFFAAKRRYDPGELFSNAFYEKYGRQY